jgi:hypothetical protein
MYVRGYGMAVWYVVWKHLTTLGEGARGSSGFSCGYAATPPTMVAFHDWTKNFVAVPRPKKG